MRCLQEWQQVSCLQQRQQVRCSRIAMSAQAAAQEMWVCLGQAQRHPGCGAWRTACSVEGSQDNRACCE